MWHGGHKKKSSDYIIINDFIYNLKSHIQHIIFFLGLTSKKEKFLYVTHKKIHKN